MCMFESLIQCSHWRDRWSVSRTKWQPKRSYCNDSTAHFIARHSFHCWVPCLPVFKLLAEENHWLSPSIHLLQKHWPYALSRGICLQCEWLCEIRTMKNWVTCDGCLLHTSVHLTLFGAEDFVGDKFTVPPHYTIPQKHALSSWLWALDIHISPPLSPPEAWLLHAQQHSPGIPPASVPAYTCEDR